VRSVGVRGRVRIDAVGVYVIVGRAHRDRGDYFRAREWVGCSRVGRPYLWTWDNDRKVSKIVFIKRGR